MTESRGDSVVTARKQWLGGFVRIGANGKPTYVIEKRIRGVLFKASTRCHTEHAALKELRRFEADPGGYRPGGEAVLSMSAELVMEYRDWMVAAPPLGRGNSRGWSFQSANFLLAWLEVFGGADLRRITVHEHIKPGLRAWKTSHPGRVTALKGFFSWLRKEKGLLRHHEDPMPDMRIPERRAAKETSTGARDVPFERVQLVYRHLAADTKPVLLLLSGTGWHLSEVRRFAEAGEIRKDPAGKHLAVLVTWHKRKESSIVGLKHQRHLDAAKLIREQGFIRCDTTLTTRMNAACAAAGLEPEDFFHLGDMRHSVGTWAIEDGDDIRDVARAFNHESEKMLRRHYVRHAVPRATISSRVLDE